MPGGRRCPSRTHTHICDPALVTSLAQVVHVPDCLVSRPLPLLAVREAHIWGRRGSRPLGRDALEGKGSQRRSQKRFDRRLERVAKAVGGGYCRLQMPLKLAPAVRGTVAGHRLGALVGGYLPPPTFQCILAVGCHKTGAWKGVVGVRGRWRGHAHGHVSGEWYGHGVERRCGCCCAAH